MTKKQLKMVEDLVSKYKNKMIEFADTHGETPCIAEFDENNPEKVNYHCYKCGAEGTTNASELDCCPVCGESIVSPREFSKRVRFLVDNGDSFTMIEGKSSVWYGERSKDTDFTMERIAIFKDEVINFFENEGDWTKKMPHDESYGYYREESVCNFSNEEVQALVAKYDNLFSPKGSEKPSYYNNCTYPTYSFKSGPSIYRLSKVAKEYNRQKKAQKAAAAADVEAFKFPELDKELVMKQLPDFTYFNEETEGMLIHRTCAHCGHKITSKCNSQEYYDSCPSCGLPLIRSFSRSNANAYTERRSLLYFEDREEGMAFYYYEVCYEFTLKGKILVKQIVSIKPYAATLFNGETFKFFKNEHGNAIQCPCSQVHEYFKPRYYPRYYGNKDFRLKIQTPEEILNILVKWNFGRTGIFALLSFDPEDPNSLTNDTFDTFLHGMMKSINLMHIYNSFKGIELLSKCGLINFVNDLGEKLSVPNFIKKKETTPTKILEISKAQFKELRKANISLFEFVQYKEILKYDPNARFIHCKRFFNRYNETPNCIDLLKLGIKKINMKEIYDYCENLDQYQCMDIYSGIQEWRDYLNMSRELKADLNNRTVLFPNSLKLEHDRAVRKVGSLRDQEVVKNFKESVEKYKYLEFEDEKHDFFIKVPSSQEELYEEGRQLHHCVGSYVNSVASGSSLILFIRKKDEPDTPLCTIEVRGNRIVQAKTRFNNPAYSVPGVRNFIFAWKKARHLEMYGQ